MKAFFLSRSAERTPRDSAHDRTQDKAVSVAQITSGRVEAEGNVWTRLAAASRIFPSRSAERTPGDSARDQKKDKAVSVAQVTSERVETEGNVLTRRLAPFLHRKKDKAVSVAQVISERAETDANVWTRRLVVFLRIMAVLAILTGLYHWAQVTGFVGSEEDAFENQPTAWQAATVYFAVIDLVAGVGLWLATPWGAVVWLSSVVSMAVIELMFPGIYGGSLLVVAGQAAMLAAYLALAFMAARERQP